MKLVLVVEKNKLLSSNWGIYELNKSEAKKYGGKFALSQGVFLDSAIKKHGSDHLLSGLKNYRYEGFFETKTEAFMQVKLVEMLCKIERLESALNNLINETKDLETPKWM